MVPRQERWVYNQKLSIFSGLISIPLYSTEFVILKKKLMANFKILPDVPEFVGLVVVDVTAGGIVLLCLVCTWGTCMKMQGKYVNHLKFIIYIILFNLIIMLNFKILPDVPE